MLFEVLLVPFYQTATLQFVSNAANATCMMWFTFAYGCALGLAAARAAPRGCTRCVVILQAIEFDF